MNLKDIQHFVAAYEARSFSRAGKALGFVQANVSFRIRSLETSLGYPLFTRLHRAVAPTPQADALYPRALVILHAFEEARRAARAAGSKRSPGKSKRRAR